MKRHLWLGAVLFAIVLTPAALAHAADPPKGFTLIPEWGVHANANDVFWHAGVQWKLKDGTWIRLEAGRWVPDPHPPAAIAAIPKDKAHCPPGLAKKGCVPPGQGKRRGPPGHTKGK